MKVIDKNISIKLQNVRLKIFLENTVQFFFRGDWYFRELKSTVEQLNTRELLCSPATTCQTIKS